MLTLAQLNLRRLRWARGLPPIWIVAERLGAQGEGQTRFEDSSRLPLGMCANLQLEAAQALVGVVGDPRLGCLVPLLRAESVDVVDGAALAAPDEGLSWWELVGRAQRVGRTLIGFFRLPGGPEEPVRLEVNPYRMPREERLVWNLGDGRTKFLLLASGNAAVSDVPLGASLAAIH